MRLRRSVLSTVREITVRFFRGVSFQLAGDNGIASWKLTPLVSRTLLSRAISILRCQGPSWLIFRLGYALKCRTGWFKRTCPCAAWAGPTTGRIRADIPLFALPAERTALETGEAVRWANAILDGKLTWFSVHEFQAGFPPDWSLNPWAPEGTGEDLRHWSELSEFANGDVKGLWEQGRFGFVFPLIRAHASSGDARYVEAFWQAVEDWREKNPPQRGPHWKCGQEVALRLMAWAAGFLAFRGQPATTTGREGMLAEMLEVSARRIEANISYALKQRNNHGMSEAAGLFTAGILLQRRGWIAKGRRLLERLARELIYDDGSFAQHSTNYHRLMLHVYLWAIRLGDTAGAPLAKDILERVRNAGLWLRAMLSHETGRVPNLGANDGAHFLDLTDLGYLDYRPTVQAVGLVTENRRWLPAGPWDELAAWLGAEATPSASPRDVRGNGDDREFTNGGYIVWRRGSTVALLRCPRRFRHRPSQCDLLHFDLWVGGRNLLRDAGSYSYNCDEPWLSYFGSSAAHNTIRFDDRDPMPKLSRFLYGAWPRLDVRCEAGETTAAYRDYRGAYHRRIVRRTAQGFVVEDDLQGSFAEATLRWRLDPDSVWTMTDSGCRSPCLELSVAAAPASAPPVFRLAEGWESLHYLAKSPLPVLEVRVGGDCRQLVTKIHVKGQVDDGVLPAVA